MAIPCLPAALADVANESAWTFEAGFAYGVARVQYAHLPADAGLWLKGRQFELGARRQVMHVLTQ